MPTKDYVRTPQKRKQKKAPQQNLPIFRILLAVVLIVSFIYALFQLSQLNQNGGGEEGLSELESIAQDELNTERTHSDLSDLAQVDQDELEEVDIEPLPVLAEEEWEYIDSLPEFKVEVDAVATSDKVSRLQCGSFRTLERAEQHKAKIAFLGHESRIQKSDTVHGVWYRVTLGPFDSRRQANTIRNQLRSENIVRCVIW